jgi:hypothetical protein
VTVVLQGPQGQQAAVTTDDGSYEFTALPLGPYVVHFYYGDVALDSPGHGVGRQDGAGERPHAAAAVQTVQVVQKAPVVDVGSSRVGVTFDKDLINNPPSPQLGGMLEKAPGAFSDPPPFTTRPRPAVLRRHHRRRERLRPRRRQHDLDRLRHPGVRHRQPVHRGGGDRHGGYSAEYGRAMGGVVNVATKSGSNEWKGSAVSYVSPGFLEARPRHVYNWSTALTSVERRQYLFNLGAELGGPIVKDKLFLWAGYAPEFGRTRTIRFINRFVDANNDGQPDGANGIPVLEELGRANFYGPISSHQYAAKLSYRPAPEHTLSLGFYGINGTHEFMRTANADPRQP